jgi:hypothetical protein
LDVLSGVLTVDMAEVDLGTLNWTYESDSYFRSSSPEGSTPPVPGGTTNIVNTKYSLYTGTLADFKLTDKTIYYGATNVVMGSSRVAIRDTAYTNAATFKAAMSGVQLVYELATPITYNLTQIEVEMLLNSNYLKSDGGVMTLTYKGTNPAILLMNKLRTNALMRKSKELQNGDLQPVLPKSKL